MTPEEPELVTSARKLLVDWANDQDGWVRSLAAEVLSTRQAVPESLLAATYEAYLVEKGLAVGEASPPGPIEFDETASAEAASFIIERLSDIEGVNALAPNQAIDFNAGLTILFGENGAGKTGYARVLKQLAAVRTAEPILPNVHDSTASKDLKATLTFRTGAGPAETLDWRGESGMAPFTRLTVFDTPSLRMHVDEHLTYIYTPSDLALFPQLDEAIGAVRQKLDDAATSKTSGGNAYLPFFTRGTSIYQLIETLGAATDLAEIERLADRDPNPGPRLTTAENSLEALKSTSIAAQLTTAKSRKDLYGGLLADAAACGGLNVAAYNEAVTSVADATADVTALREDLYAAAGLPGEGDQTWQAFILTGETYIEHRGTHEYPSDGDGCIYCQQPLDSDALALVRRYREFANNSAQKQAAASRQTMSTLTGGLRSIGVEPQLATIATHQDPNDPDPILADAQRLLEEVRDAQAAVSAGAKIAPTALQVDPDWITETTSRRDAAQTLITDLSGRAEERRLALQKAQAELNDLKDGIELSARLDGIKSYVADAKWAQKAVQLSKRIPPVRTSLTNVSKVASEQLVNTDFAKHFEEECEALKAPVVGLEFPGQKGRAARRKTVPVAKHPSEVLSEGEQKVIGLADFLAEAGLRLSPSPIVLDDPVNSLDYRRIRQVADRVARLAHDRQVIVFTHNIWFAAELLARFEKDTTRCTYYGITDDQAKGIVVPGSHPRWDTVSKTTGKINKLVEAARAADDGAVQDALVESAYSTIRNWCETVVEMELLAGVTQRYQPNVMMTALDKIKGSHLEAACDVLAPLFKKACRITEAHSQPLETLSVRPTVSELEADWSALQAARKSYADASAVAAAHT